MSREKKNPLRLGRPRMKPAERRAVNLTIRLTVEERAVLKKAAQAQSVSITDLLLAPWRETEEE